MPPKRKATSAPATEDPPHLQPGSQVEVTSTEDPGFYFSWFTGSILKRVSSRNPNKFVVQYNNLFQDKAETKLLTENVNAVDIRPLPPRERARKFKVAEEVDAFYNDGWWEGLITDELENGKFLFYCKTSKEQLEFGEDQLRLHREWLNGSWMPPLEENEQAEEVNSFAYFFFLDTFHLLGLHKEWVNGSWTPPLEENEQVEEVVSDSQYKVYFRTTNEEKKFSHADLRAHHDWVNGAWVGLPRKGPFEAVAVAFLVHCAPVYQIV
ncbi:hypothetical protein REPUB_Repub16aG0150300 [Reevesia pubescens]